MSYQVRHSDFGVFQGSCMGMGFWYPMSEMPEQGLCEFPTKIDAQEYIDFLTTKADQLLNPSDMSIEQFNIKLNKILKTVGRNKHLEYFCHLNN